MQRGYEEGLTAGFVAAILSGLPSTLWSLAARRDPLEPNLERRRR